MKQYSIAQVADLLGVTRQCVWQWIAMRKLKAQRLGSFWVINATELEKFKETRALNCLQGVVAPRK